MGKRCEVGLMSLREKYLRTLSGMVPFGAAGVTLLLGATAPASADLDPAGIQARPVYHIRVSERLAAIRDAVSDAAGPSALKANHQLAWWAWRNGGGGWRNGGAWRNGGWRNGGWRNYWRNW
jgi:rSAM-associated Gly-rich repeat protein